MKKERGVKETNEESGNMHRTFRVWPRSMGSALGGCLMHHAAVRSSGEYLVNDEGTLQLELELVLFLLRQA